MFGCCELPILTGPPGSCNSEASKCALFIFGAHESQTTPFYLFKAARKTTVPICVDDDNEQAADVWEELMLVQGGELVHMLSPSSRVGTDWQRAHTPYSISTS